jgi:hypothetical protein
MFRIGNNKKVIVVHVKRMRRVRPNEDHSKRMLKSARPQTIFSDFATTRISKKVVDRDAINSSSKTNKSVKKERNELKFLEYLVVNIAPAQLVPRDTFSSVNEKDVKKKKLNERN